MRMEFLTTRRWSRFVGILLLSVILTACGTDDNEDEPVATSGSEGAQPTVAVEEGTPDSGIDAEMIQSTPTNTDMSEVPPSVTNAAEDATPATTLASGGDAATAVPADDNDDVSPPGSPVVTANATPLTPGVQESSATPAMSRQGAGGTEGDPVVGDGTTGASVDVPRVATPPVPVASPSSSPVAATPVAATPMAQVAVTGCEVENIPAFTGEQTTYSLTTDVNFRAGPGTDCDLALETPLGEFRRVEIIGGPVTREDDGTEWVQISVLGTEGWISFDLLAPVS